MPEMIDIEQHIVDLLKTVNAVDVIHKLNVTIKTYPGKKVTGRLNIGGAVQDFVLGGENTDAQKKEYILLLETMLPETIQDTFHGINVLCELPPEYNTAKRNKVIITGWIKEQKEVYEFDITKKDPIPEPSNVEAQSAPQKVLLLCKFGLFEYLENECSLTKNQSYKIIGTLTGVRWDTIQRIYNAYKTGIDYPRNENKNNPDNETNRRWLLNLLNEYKIHTTK